ncbi:MAG: tRNA (guanosine(46)-N7)-methyltransferase TrmB [Chlamydiales bacterium]|nr:tRNA (guanosine(46)-N7)-methyltransferase TrmB [Chlamydiia bacterium]MCP5508339.1 tRNA (guanosine(46)-N7)-methyltransferase TrmB [Chlamydiales bacterium]
MKPKDLNPPFSERSERRVLIDDRIWYVPDKDHPECSFAFPGWNHPDLFGNDNPVHVEYCSGNGAWIASKAQQNPDINWVALEIKFKRCRKIWSKIHNLKLNNLIVICGEGLRTTRDYFPEESISHAYVNFPDPWPKKRHAKNRIIQPPFISEVARVLKLEAPFTLVTDDADYSLQMIETLQEHHAFDSSLPAPYFVDDWNHYGSSYFDSLWRERGRQIRYHQFIRQKAS